ncbi:2190_t:CDS:2, partial [Gigaspora margarita]
VSVTSIKVLEFDFENILALGINMTIVGITTQIVQNTGNDLTLEFYVKKKVGNREPSNFWQSRKPHGATPKALRKNHTTLSNMNPTSTSQTQSLLSALKTNPIPN